jgi:plastocyanin
MNRPLLAVVLCALAVAVLLPASAGAATEYAQPVDYPGLQHLTYKFGPIDVTPGQNTIEIKNNTLRPDVPGYITAFKPNLTYLNGKVPRVDVIHLHHGVWLVNGAPTWAAGEEKTNFYMPQGYGYRYDPKQDWHLNYMIHNLTPAADKVYLTYEIDFLPDSAPAAAAIKTVRTQWMDVAGIRAYPVFDALRKYADAKGEYTFPTQTTDPVEKAKIGPAQSWTVTNPGTLVATAGHLHPGGLHTDLYLTRNGRTVDLFRSDAHYFEPAGAVSWDVAMTGTRPDWKVQVQPGDVVSVTGTYDARKASWYESMAIMPVAFSPGDTTGIDPFSDQLDKNGLLNHGHLAENDNHGGRSSGLPDARTLMGASADGSNDVTIKGFIYQQGDLTLTGRRGRVPVVKQGKRLTFVNRDSSAVIWHTITACKSPCTGSTGIAYPLADGHTDFDSGELGYGPANFTAAANRDTWSTPANLKPGTYTYFCRIHPFMRGAFRVVAR